LNVNLVFASNTQTAVFSRINYAGAKHAALADSTEAYVNDIFSISLNPAGLYGIKQFNSGDGRNSEEITEEDLTSFTDEESIVQSGVDFTKIDSDQYWSFAGLGFDLLDGMFGVAAAYYKNSKYIINTGLESDYNASIVYLTYSYNFLQIINFGISLKYLNEKVDDVSYDAVGADVGLQIDVLPLLKFGAVVQDLGSELISRDKDKENRKIDPTLRIGISINTPSNNLLVSASYLNKNIEDEDEYRAGISFLPHEVIALNMGIKNKYYTGGVSLNINNFKIDYALEYEKKKKLYNNTISAVMNF
jgi:hypothetical protein